jgi:hypothetical protein
MRAFDFVMTLYSFVYALGVAQILATVGDMVRAGKRLRFSWLNAGWMLNVLLAIVAWWLSLWDLRSETSWPMPTVLVFFAVACLLYLLARLVSAPIPAEGTVDLRLYHHEEVRKYASLFTVEVALTIASVFLYGSASQNWVASNYASWPTLAASLAAAISRNRWIQASALVVIMVMWGWYFATLQSALT